MLSPRHREVMEVIRTNSGISFNALYIATSPVCQRTGRRRSSGTSSWTIPATLQQLGLVRKEVDTRNVVLGYRDRFKVRYHFYLTKAGEDALA